MQFAVLDIVGRGFVDDVVACLQADIGAADAAAGVGDILRSSKFKVFTGCDRAAVANISATDTAVAGSCYRAGIGKRITCYQMDIAASQQSAVSFKLALTYRCQIDDGNKYILSVDFLLYQPDDVCGQVGHLFSCQRYAYSQAKFISSYGGIVHQFFKLFFITGKTSQILLACQVQNLLAYQLLFSKAVAQTFHYFLRVAADTLKQIIAGQEIFIIRKPRVHFDKVICRRVCWLQQGIFAGEVVDFGHV